MSYGEIVPVYGPKTVKQELFHRNFYFIGNSRKTVPND